MSDRNRPAITLLLPTADPWLPDDPRARDAALDQQLMHLDHLAQRARRRAAGRKGATGGENDEEEEDVHAVLDDVDTELKPRGGRLC